MRLDSGTTRAATVILCIWMMLLCLCSCGRAKRTQRQLNVFAAACLNTALAEFERAFERKYPEMDVRVAISGSLVAARKISEYGLRGDIVMSADKRVIDSLLIPRFTDWQMAFASNEVVMAFSENSRHAVEVSPGNWPKILLEPEVRVARVDENLGPLGYQTLLVWKLADMYYRERLDGKSLYEALGERVTPKMIRPDAAELLPTLGTEADYIFVYRSMARDHNLKHILLPAEVNLASLERRDLYSKASVRIFAAPDTPLVIHGEPILFSLSILREAPNYAGAVSFVKTLLGPEGRAILRRHGLSPLSPARFYGRAESLPEGLRDLVADASSDTESTR